MAEAMAIVDQSSIVNPQYVLYREVNSVVALDLVSGVRARIFEGESIWFEKFAVLK